MVKKIHLANTPTPIHKIQLIDADLPVNLYIKRDDFTGVGLSGNKIRKLEYLLQKAIDDKVTDIITCGAIQSNHCRATAIACAKLGLKSHLLLAGNEDLAKEGNNFLDVLAGAGQRFISQSEYSHKRDKIMDEWKNKLELDENVKVMVIPEGASCGLGSFGYLDAYQEILNQEKEMGVNFDTILITTGSAGSLAGLLYGNEKFKTKKDIIGISISATVEEIIEDKLLPILNEMKKIEASDYLFNRDTIHILDGYQGKGYGKSTIDELEFIRDFTSQTGVILDPVYTGKAMYGIINELTRGSWPEKKNILFIHTGGAFGWTREMIDRLLSHE